MLTVLLLVLAAPGKGAASSALPNRASVFISPKETAEPHAAKVESQLLKALDKASVPVTDLESLFPEEASANRGLSLMKDGTDAVDNLDFDLAAAKFKEALTSWDQNPATADPKELATAHLHLANIALQTGGKPGLKVALEEVTKAVIYFPGVELDPKYFGADVKKVHEKALADMAKLPKAALTIHTAPGGAEVHFRGAPLGTTPLTEAAQVPTGRHLIVARRPGFTSAGVFMNVAKDGEVSLELAPAEGYGAAIKSMKGLIATNLGKGVPKDAMTVAETMKSRFLIVAEVAPGGDGTLEVWDVETRARLKEVSLPTDGNFGPVADKVKAFIANPSPVAVAKKDSKNEVRDTAEPSSGDSVFSKPWFWGVVGGVVAVGAGAAVVGVVASQPSQPRTAFNPVLFPF